MTSKRKQAATAGAITLANIAVAISVNLLTSGWSWLVFAVLALLSGAWVGLEAWRAVPRGKSIAAPVPPDVTDGFVPRPELTSRIVRALLANKSNRVGITTGVAGAGGFGKTTLAKEVCTLPEVKAAFDWIDWVEVGQEVRGGAALADTINNVSERISGQRPGLTSPEQAGIRLGELLKSKGRALLVVDDIWTAEQLRPFLNAGRGCTLLVTTRIPNLLPTDTEPVEVDQMSRSQARELVSSGLTALPESLGEQLLEITGRWPLALNLANATLRRAAREGANVADTATQLLRRLQNLGPTALDVTDAARRDRTVAATVESSLSMLGDRRDRVAELAIFPEDTEIPVDLVAMLWQKTSGLSPEDGYHLTHDLAELSLITWRGDRVNLRLHDVIRAYMRHECGDDRLKQLHSALLDAVAATLPKSKWWMLPTSPEYLWRNLTYHLEGASRRDELGILVTEPPWIITKLCTFGPVAVAEDLALADIPAAVDLGRFFDQNGHLLIPAAPGHAVVNALAQRLPDQLGMARLRIAAEVEVADKPRLVPLHALPDLPDPALNRVLAGHDSPVHGCVFAPDGSWLATAATDGLRIWHPVSGRLIRLVEDAMLWFHNDNLVLSPDGRLLATGEGRNDTIAVLDTSTWQVQVTLPGHRDWMRSVCFLSDSRTLVSIGDDKQLVVWDIGTGRKLDSAAMRETPEACVSLRDGRVLTVDRTGLQLWDLSRRERGFRRHSAPLDRRHVDLPPLGSLIPTSLAISPDGQWAVVPGDDGLAVQNLTNIDEPSRLLRHHTDLTAAAFSPDGRVLATGSESGMVVLWDTDAWCPSGEIAAHGSTVESLAFAPNNSVLASGGDDGTVRLWDPSKVRAKSRNDRPIKGTVDTCATPPDGAWLAVPTSDAVAICEPGMGHVSEEIKVPGSIRRIATVGHTYLAVEQYGDVLIYDVDNWQVSRSLRHPAESRLSGLVAGGSFVCLTDDEGRVAIWDTETWRPPVFLEFTESGMQVTVKPATEPDTLIDRVSRRLKRRSKVTPDIGLSISPDGEWLAVSAGQTVHITKPRGGEPITTLSFDKEVEGTKATPNGRLLAVRLDDTIQYWSTMSWTRESEFTDHLNAASATDGRWSPDCSVIVTVSDDRTLRILDSKDWTCLTELRLDGELSGCTWLDNERLAVVGGHGVYWFKYIQG